MTTKTKILALLAFIAIGIGIYAISGGSGNEQMAEKTQPSANAPTADVLAALKPMTKGKMAAMRVLDAPVDLSNVAFGDGDGNPLTIGDWKGRVVLLNIWATWCPPCRHEMPWLDSLQKQLGGPEFEVVSVSIDLRTQDKPRAFFAETNLKELGFYWDGTAKIFTVLKRQGLAFGMPSTILIDKNGMALAALNGPAEWHSADAVALINTVLK